MSDRPFLLFAYRLGARNDIGLLDNSAIAHWTPASGEIWLHFDAAVPATKTWLDERADIQSYVVEGLLADETRPRLEVYDDGMLLILRGVNLNPGANPEDMVSIRIWIDENRIVTTCLRRLLAVEEIRTCLENKTGPLHIGQFITWLAALLTDNMCPTIEQIGETIADPENEIVEEEKLPPNRFNDIRRNLISARRLAISLRRYIAPLRDAIVRLSVNQATWLGESERGRLRETADRVTRITEELDQIRERAAVIQDELANQMSHRMERTMYVLTVVAAVMLPLGFITGLLGINVGGLPGMENSMAFWIVCVLLALLAVAEIWLLRKLNWL